MLDDSENPVDNLSVEGEGTWSVLGNGSVLFTPVEDLTGDPTPISYQVIDVDGQASAAAEIAIDYQDVLGGMVAIERVSADDFYLDSGDNITSSYVAYEVTNTSDEDIEDLWVEIGDFAGGNIDLAEGESSQVNLGALASGESTTTFFYLTANGATTIEQSHTVSAYDGNPTAQGIFQGDGDFSFTEVTQIDADTRQGDRNQVTSVNIESNPALPGDTVTVTVDGETGTIGDEGILSFTPASFTNWNPDTYELIDTAIAFDGGGIGTVEDRLTIQAPDASGQNLPYTATYTFEVAATGDTNTELSPIGNISSGTEINHTDTTNFASFDELQVSTGTGAISGAVWDDVDYDGVLDLGETGVGNVAVDLFSNRNSTTPQATFTTDISGVYQFNSVPVGNYYLEFTEPLGYATSPEDRDSTGTDLAGLRYQYDDGQN